MIKNCKACVIACACWTRMENESAEELQHSGCRAEAGVSGTQLPVDVRKKTGRGAAV